MAGRAFTAATIVGKRSLNESSLREKSDTSVPLRTAIQRNPSNFGSKNHAPPGQPTDFSNWKCRPDRPGQHGLTKPAGTNSVLSLWRLVLPRPGHPVRIPGLSRGIPGPLPRRYARFLQKLEHHG